jgi:hypothetical protein
MSEEDKCHELRKEDRSGVRRVVGIGDEASRPRKTTNTDKEK